MYVAVKGGDAAIENSQTLLAEERRGDRRVPELTLDQIKNQLKNINQIKTNPIKNLSKDNQNTKIEITSFQDLINLANKEKEIELKYDLERNVKLVSFNLSLIHI